MKQRIEHIKKLIGANELEHALNELTKFVSANPKLSEFDNEIIQLKGRLEKLKKEDINGTISFDESQLHRNKLSNSSLKLIVEIEIVLNGGNVTDKKNGTKAAPVTSRTCLLLIPILLIALFLGIGGISYYKFFYEPNRTIFLYGKVYDFDDNNNPVRNANVTIIDLHGFYSKTDSNGAFKFEIDKSERKTLDFEVNHPNYKSQNFMIRLSPGNDNEQYLEKFLLEKKKKAKESELQRRLEAEEREREVAEARKKNVELQARLAAEERARKAAEEKARNAELQAIADAAEKQNSMLESGVKLFLNNYSSYKMFLGENYGYGSVTSVSYSKTSGRLVIRYSYKNGEAVGFIDKHGYYQGKYSTDSSSGEFNMQFQGDGTSKGRWNGPFGLGGGAFSLKKR